MMVFRLGAALAMMFERIPTNDWFFARPGKTLHRREQRRSAGAKVRKFCAFSGKLCAAGKPALRHKYTDQFSNSGF